MKRGTIHIQSLLSLVCRGPWAFLESATQTTTIPTTTTTTVAATGTAIFQSTQSGIHGKSIFMAGKSLAGAIVPKMQQILHCTFVIVSSATQDTDHDYGSNNHEDGSHYGYYKVKVRKDYLDGALFGDFTSRGNSTWNQNTGGVSRRFQFATEHSLLLIEKRISRLTFITMNNHFVMKNTTSKWRSSSTSIHISL